MSKPPRPSLDSLSDRFARKPDSPPSPVTASEPDAPSAGASVEPPATPKAKKDDRVQILTRIDAPTRKRLRLIALEQDRTVQEICEEAIRDFVARHSK